MALGGVGQSLAFLKDLLMQRGENMRICLASSSMSMVSQLGLVSLAMQAAAPIPLVSYLARALASAKLLTLVASDPATLAVLLSGIVTFMKL